MTNERDFEWQVDPGVPPGVAYIIPGTMRHEVVELPEDPEELADAHMAFLRHLGLIGAEPEPEPGGEA